MSVDLQRLPPGVIMSWALLPWALAYLYFMWWRPAHHLEQVGLSFVC
jgi:hypothetical protein